MRSLNAMPAILHPASQTLARGIRSASLLNSSGVSASHLSEEIEVYTRHSVSVDISDNQITLGDITVETVETEQGEGSGSEDEEEKNGIPASPTISIILGLIGFYFLSKFKHKPT